MAGTHSPGSPGPGGGPGRTVGGVLAVVTLLAVLVGAGYAVVQLRRSGVEHPDAGPAAAPTTPSPAAPSPTPSPTPEPGRDITGPLDLLLVGVDTRIGVPGWEPHGDAVLVMHVTRELDRAYLFSLPRDLVVELPPFPKADFDGERTKLTHAMSYGSRVPGKRGKPNTAQGYELLETAVRDYTGIDSFEAGAVLTFEGFDDLVDALGGIDLYVDQRVVSQHRRPDGRHRAGGANGYVGPQMVYERGNRHLVGWQALDYARQRYTTGGDYARQRHQQQLVRAIVRKILSQELARDPDRLDRVVRALGAALTFQGNGQRVVDFAFALSRLPVAAITLVSLPGHSVSSGGRYRGEQLDQVGRDFLTELVAGRADAFLSTHPKLVVRD
ncbi:LCP family protein [Micromonospora sp. NPDC049559]|uniref:LCP family protein n=1 Tax=Micromonospora sp. NPDC049559 TaxID=3155923 RepID=UPI0034403B26